jgi:hypothetical protein
MASKSLACVFHAFSTRSSDTWISCSAKSSTTIEQADRPTPRDARFLVGLRFVFSKITETISAIVSSLTLLFLRATPAGSLSAHSTKASKLLRMSLGSSPRGGGAYLKIVSGLLLAKASQTNLILFFAACDFAQVCPRPSAANVLICRVQSYAIYKGGVPL